MMMSSAVDAEISRHAGKNFFLNDQRMITTGKKMILHARKDRLAIVTNFRSFAMHQFGRANHLAAKRLADSLMAQTHAEQRYLSGESLYYVESDSGIVR